MFRLRFGRPAIPTDTNINTGTNTGTDTGTEGGFGWERGFAGHLDWFLVQACHILVPPNIAQTVQVTQCATVFQSSSVLRTVFFPFASSRTACGNPLLQLVETPQSATANSNGTWNESAGVPAAPSAR